ncbi:winged helix-turn-helix domain-containing protein [Providencia hangzhouensis]|uniref:DNA-binding transcriptional activator CadC n=2 Tax=Providencia TaxID=586 RepID=A0A9N8D0D5_PRORE|nr:MULTISPECIES: winged helix family transcriptional regulator [Providencia]MBN6366400.1 winged helix-turn-helix domain-containing protein [Providencia rettgeri]MBN7843451.1 winged helix-turn-helix domain-containing protein [Providencia rettgeri]MBN7854643.1 winged helix-turn-helix domain-containing protein [Providencia rettgeri]MBN7862963.1 winged helix-turn-helix domain-containing protein [Providencia rettgeri]MBN7872535.1 winged helix-turn-helix domain-containing protein [Providencia rettge
MKYKINAFILYDAVDGTLSLKEDEVDAQLSITANALLFYFIQHRGVVSRDEVLKAVWDDNGLVSSNSNLNQYLSILRKAFRPYGIENIIVTVARGRLEFNSDVSLELIDDIKIPSSELIPSLSEIEEAKVVLSPIPKPISEPVDLKKIESTLTPEKKEICWYLASGVFLLCSVLLAVMAYLSNQPSVPIKMTVLEHTNCDVLSNEKMINNSVALNYVQNFDKVRNNLNLACAEKERFVFFYGDKLQTNGLGRVFLAHCAVNEDNPFSYCDNYFYYSWKPS